MKVKELIEALQKCDPEAPVILDVDLSVNTDEVRTVQYNVMWLRDKGDLTSPGKVHLHNNATQFAFVDGKAVEQETSDAFILT